jgi:CheY-like chemotaxis protein
MLFPKSGYDPETVALMGRACDEAWRELQFSVSPATADEEREARTLMAIRVMSAVNEGERDPRRLKSIALRHEAQTAPNRLAGQVILFVEDEPLILLAAQQLLEDEGARVLPTTSVQSALERLHAEEISAAILDYRLQGGTADDLCRTLVARKIPFVIYSGYPNVEGECSRWEIVSKPADPRLLVTLVLSVLVANRAILQC